MNTHIKFWLCLAISVFANSAFSSPVNTIKSKKPKTNITRLQSNNFDRRLSCEEWYGDDWCNAFRSGDPNVMTCMPIENKGYHEISLSLKLPKGMVINSGCDSKNCIVHAGKVETIYSEAKDINSVTISVTNTNTKKEIYNGPINDWLGLSCNGNTCRDWKRPKKCKD